MSSKDFPFVSGTRKKIKNIPTKLNPAYIQNVGPVPIVADSVPKVLETKKVRQGLRNPIKGLAIVFISFAKSSETSSQGLKTKKILSQDRFNKI